MNTFCLLDILEEDKKPKPVCVVKLQTSYWYDKKGLYSKQSIIFLHRKSSGYQILEEDLSMVGADLVFPRIINLKECEDGLYQIVTCNESKDWETGTIDDYDYKLIPFKE